ncbi:uncharacterized protein BO87DRAFT_439015 [Aspergillus neoniger CBS 115656]|uniref:Uncharacterized protein n=1 Tax=Aspergillus neoniger (strain CBS 115656) TaxID=1448310 RepID=A0A318YEW3_ASPNB|nr:hypothetical protein BO87DRAFT_439015 [Aspergillus neoniger CBS 115656]PYH32951.1 hypothetical protein BO87DRAFT_439015 [Aspergillus neoniger CBS 115656]
MLPLTRIHLLYLLLLLASSVQAFNTIHTNCTLPPQHANFVTAPNTLGTLQILWSSLFTILACTWTVLHLNVPGYKQKPKEGGITGWLKWMVIKYRHPTKWFLLTVLAPEVPFAKYWDDQVQAHSLFYHYEDIFEDKHWTKTHVLFANMGGFAVKYKEKRESYSTGEKMSAGDLYNSPAETRPALENNTFLPGGSGRLNQSTPGPASKDPAGKFDKVFYLTATEALKLLCKDQGTPIPGLDNTSVEEINDRSKTDIFMRLLAVGQILWVVVQIISRGVYGLTVTQLEVTVVAFAFCAPKGVNCPILFEYSGTRKDLEGELSRSKIPTSTKIHNKWAFYQCKYCKMEKTSSSSDSSENSGNNENCDNYEENTSRGTNERIESNKTEPQNNSEKMRPKVLITAAIRGVRECLGSPRTSGDAIENGFIDESEDSKRSCELLTDMSMFISSMVFGGIHLIAWGFQFPTIVEKYLWWAAALWCTFCVLACTLLCFMFVGLEKVINTNSSDPAESAPKVSNTSLKQDSSNINADLDAKSSPGSSKRSSPETQLSAPLSENQASNRDEESQESRTQPNRPVKKAIVGFVVVLSSVLAYIVARLFIVVEMFRTLAFLPQDAYVATWSSEIPNIG